MKESNEYYDTAVLLGTDLARDVGNWIETRSLESRDELHPEDSISNAGSRASLKSSRRLRKGSSIVLAQVQFHPLRRRLPRNAQLYKPKPQALKASTPSKRKNLLSSNEEKLWNSKQKSERRKLRS